MVNLEAPSSAQIPAAWAVAVPVVSVPGRSGWLWGCRSVGGRFALVLMGSQCAVCGVPRTEAAC